MWSQDDKIEPVRMIIEKKAGMKMSVTAFINSFLSYLLLFGMMVIIVAIGLFIGITLRKRKNAKDNQEKPETTEIVTENTANQ